MAYYEKKIVYLSYVDKYKEYDNRIKGAGFLRIEIREDACSLDMHVNGMQELEDGKHDIKVIYAGGEEYRIGSLYMHHGEGEWKENYSDGKLTENNLSYTDIHSFVVQVSEGEIIEGINPLCRNREERKTPELEGGSKKAVKIKTGGLRAVRAIRAKNMEVREGKIAETQEAETQTAGTQATGIQAVETQAAETSCVKTDFGKTESHEIKMDAVILNDKWEQLCQLFPVVHPYQDEREYISICPKDFVIMTGDYQHLANNSFLLHGFYNYKHIILGREQVEAEAAALPEEKDAAGKGCFYLGVPGVYYEREKMVALMFGFEAFECNGGRAEPGKFGYYLRRVGI